MIKDGLKYCDKCNTKKQCYINVSGKRIIVDCICKCENEAYEREKEYLKQAETRMKAEELRLNGIKDKSLLHCRFENAHKTQIIGFCERYASNCDKVIVDNIGMLLWGVPGGGKTYSAACIVNAFIDKGIPSLITSFPKILSASFREKSEFISNISKFKLMVIDDFGMERNTEYSIETVSTIIDERYKSGLPLIVTTNLTLDKIENPENIDCKRIYSRILSMCTPIYVKPQRFREKTGKDKMRIANDIFNGE